MQLLPVHQRPEKSSHNSGCVVARSPKYQVDSSEFRTAAQMSTVLVSSQQLNQTEIRPVGATLIWTR
jgi:hypothetical protein